MCEKCIFRQQQWCGWANLNALPKPLKIQFGGAGLHALPLAEGSCPTFKEKLQKQPASISNT
jgi:hypothetical protein